MSVKKQKKIQTHRDYHLRTGDYFAYLATILGFTEEVVKDCQSDDKHTTILHSIRDDLVYLQKNFRIEAKN